MRPCWFSGWLAISVASAPVMGPWGFVRAQADATAEDTEARARDAFQRGRVHYDNGEFAQAAESFEEAYRLSGRDALLYNLYLARRDANQTEKAAEALRAYLTKVEVVENRPQLEARLKALDEGLAERHSRDALSPQNPVETKQPAATAPAAEPAATPAAETGWWIVPVAVAAGGAVLALASIGTGLSASNKAKELDAGCTDGVCPARLKSTADQGKLLSVTTDVLLFGGLTLVGAGVVLYVLRMPRSAPGSETARATLRPDLGCSAVGCAGSLSLSF